MKNSILISIIFICCIACSNPRRFTYFKDVPDTITNYNILDTGYKTIIIKSDDVLQVNISSPNPEASSFFVTPGAHVGNSTGIPTNEPASPNTYLVDKQGGIELPLIGWLSLRGLSTVQAKEVVKDKVSAFLKNPIVTVRLQNFKVTVLGEVNRPSNYIVPNERVSVLDAIGMAGDLTLFGRRENVLLIRENEGKKILARLDLNSSKLFQSPYYYLQQNDILYVEPNKQRAASSDMTTLRNVSLITSLAGLATIVVSQLIR